MTTSSAPTVPPARRLTATPLLVDALIALGLTALSVIAIVGGAGDAGGRDPLSVVLLLAETLPLVARRRWPIPVLAVTLGATLLHAWLAQTSSLTESLGSLVALFTVAELYDRRVSVVATIVVAVAYFAMIAAKVGIPAGLSGLIQTQLAVLGACRPRDLGADAAALCLGRGRDGTAPDAGRRDGGRTSGPGRAGPDRAGAARHRQPSRERDGHPGRGGADRARPTARRGEGRAGGHRRTGRRR